jgi:hypothetical protein
LVQKAVDFVDRWFTAVLVELSTIYVECCEVEGWMLQADYDRDFIAGRFYLPIDCGEFILKIDYEIGWKLVNFLHKFIKA